MINKNTKYQDYNINSLSFRAIFVLLAFLFVVLLEIGIRVVPRALNSSMDFKSIYIASSAWAKGLDPYNRQILDGLWIEEGNSIVTASNLLSIYPITTYSILSILSILSWENAKLIWLLINIGACFFIWLGLIKLLKFKVTDGPSILLIAALFALSPVQNCIFQGQPVLVVLSLIVFSICLSEQRHDVLSGTLIGLSLGLKPQIGIFILVYYVIRNRWLLIGSAILTTLLIAALGIIRLGLRDFTWLSSWQNNLQIASLAINSPISTKSTRHTLLHLQYLINTFLNNTYLVYIIVSIFMLVSLVLFNRYRCGRSDIKQILLEISFLAIICLFPFYHRNYDAAILVFPLSYAILLTTLESDKFGKIMLLIMLPFLIPGPSLLFEIDKIGYIPSALTKSWIWKTFIIPHQIWLLLILSCLLIYIMSLNKRKDYPYEETHI